MADRKAATGRRGAHEGGRGPARATRASRAAGHDHARCVTEALASASALCAERGARLTPLRRRVLELVWASHKPIGAYALMDRLKRGGAARPPTVYRALEFLMAEGLVHRIESLNAFVGCDDPVRAHDGVFLICTRCGDARELAGGSVDAAIRREASAAGFAVESRTVEASGLCPDCRADAPR